MVFTHGGVPPEQDVLHEWWSGLSRDEQVKLKASLDMDPPLPLVVELLAREPLGVVIAHRWGPPQDPTVTVVPPVVRMFILEQQV
jgi:hypothetical protein